MGGKFKKLEKAILVYAEKIRKEDNSRNRYELRRIFKRKMQKLENRKRDTEDRRRRYALLS